MIFHMYLSSIVFHICFIYFYLAFKSTTTIQQRRQLNINDNATTQQQLDYAVCMWYQSTLEYKLLKSSLEYKLLKSTLEHSS